MSQSPSQTSSCNGMTVRKLPFILKASNQLLRDDEVVCEFIGGPADGLLRLVTDPDRYRHCGDNEMRAYWVDTKYVSPGIHIEM